MFAPRLGRLQVQHIGSSIHYTYVQEKHRVSHVCLSETFTYRILRAKGELYNAGYTEVNFK